MGQRHDAGPESPADHLHSLLLHLPCWRGGLLAVDVYGQAGCQGTATETLCSFDLGLFPVEVEANDLCFFVVVRQDLLGRMVSMPYVGSSCKDQRLLLTGRELFECVAFGKHYFRILPDYGKCVNDTNTNEFAPTEPPSASSASAALWSWLLKPFHWGRLVNLLEDE